MTLETLFTECWSLLPELILGLTICVVIVGDMLTPLSNSRRTGGLIALFGIVVAIAALSMQFNTQGHAILYFSDSFVRDPLSLIFKLIFLVGGGICVLFSMRSKELSAYRLGEYYGLLLGAVLSASLLASSHTLLMLVVSFETLSMCSYILAGFVKHERASSESALKYMLYGAVCSGIMLFGLSYFYGLTGTLNISECMSLLARDGVSGENTLGIVLASILVLSGVGFKIALLPFHFWCPEVYQGAPTPITAFLSVVSKSAGFAALIRLCAPVIKEFQSMGILSSTVSLGFAQILFGLLAAATMTYGNLVALRQTDAKRLLAYSSIAHAGYLLLALAVFQPEAIEALMVYLMVFLFMNLGAFWIIQIMVNERGSASIKRFRGAAYQAPFLFIVLFICLISLTGLPPTAGFAAKFLLFKTVVAAGINAMPQNGSLSPVSIYFFALAFIGVMNSVVSLFYYMKLVKVMVFEKSDEERRIVPEVGDRIYAAALCVPVILFLNFGPLVNMVKGVLESVPSLMVSGVG